MKNSFTPNSSKSSSSVNNEGMYCCCGLNASLKTSWTKANPGRKFWSCPKFGQDGYCGHFKWAEEELCQRAKQIIPGLLAKINKLQQQIEESQTKEEQLKTEIMMANSRVEMLKQEVIELKKKNRSLVLILVVIVSVFVGYALT
ncbi:hypothetical protein DH2020_044640 [Rehmannia glutinosa]|uniref:GRF-type domain-containing protein n=1 Tax=Rehmannia glutinosa TaxID=99300 RepID=A0ABR0UGC9_REHGL